MNIYIQTKKHTFKWNYKKFIKNVATVATIATWIGLYIAWFLDYNTYLNSLMK